MCIPGPSPHPLFLIQSLVFMQAYENLDRMLPSLFYLPPAFDEIPDGEQIPHIQELGSHDDDLISIDSSSSEALYSSKKLHPPVLISNGIPPIPLRLVKRVEEGLFIEMAELHPSYLDSAELNIGDQPAGSHKRFPEICDIVDWIQCFGIYMAIISRSKPKRIADLIGYQSIIIGASQLGHEGRWILYDRHFRLKASASGTRQWSTIDITIWNMAFPDRVIKSHQGQGLDIRSTPLNYSQRPPRQNLPFPKRMAICLDWNDSPNGCTRANCRYEHVCYRCVHSPKEQDKHHKASQCVAAQRLSKQSERPRPLLP